MKNFEPKKKVFLVFTILVTSATAFSQDSAITKLSALSLKDLLNVKITTVSRNAQAIGIAPATVVLVSKTQIAQRNYQSLLDVLYDLPDIKIEDKVYSGVRNIITVRGTRGIEKFVIMIDGIKISSPSGEALPVMENYPVHSAEQIEIVYGPASALYGADAVSGVINIITKKLSQQNIIAEASTATGTSGYTNTTLFIAKKIAENSSFTASGQYSQDNQPDLSKVYKDDASLNVDHYKTGVFNTIYGPQKPAKFVRPSYEAPTKAYNAFASLKLGDFTASWFRNYAQTSTAYGNNTSNAIYNKDVFMGQTVNNLSASYRKTIGIFNSATFFVASQYELDPNTNYRNLYTGMEAAYKYAETSMIKIEQQVDYKPTEKINVTAGIAYDRYTSTPQSADLKDPVNTKSFVTGSYLGTETFYRPEGLAAQFYHIRYQNFGTYIQGQITASSKLNFTIGTRYDYNSRYGETFNPRLGLVYTPNKKTTVKFLYGSAFLAPTPSDAYVQYGSFYSADSGRTYQSSFLHLPNPYLKPVMSHTFELSVRRTLADNLILSVNGYFTLIKGLLIFSDDNSTTKLYNNSFNGIPVDYIEVFTNNNRQKNYGGSMQLEWKHSFGNALLKSYASINYINGAFEDGLSEKRETGKDTELDFISHYTFRLGGDLSIGKFSISPRLSLLSRQNITGLADTTGAINKRQTIPGYALLNVSTNFQLGDKLTVFANVSNALNQKFRSVGFNMDIQKTDTEVFHGQRMDPIRITGGLRFAL
ncbi:MAG: TonB-dependent receptor [Gemmatimonadaceae bacterium]|nr:TonB-dependent receptor [Chitinophagaceae bacterium]